MGAPGHGGGCPLRRERDDPAASVVRAGRRPSTRSGAKAAAARVAFLAGAGATPGIDPRERKKPRGFARHFGWLQLQDSNLRPGG